VDNRSGSNTAAARKTRSTRAGRTLPTVFQPQNDAAQVPARCHGFDNLYQPFRPPNLNKIPGAKPASLGKINQKFVLQMSTMESAEARDPGQPTAFFVRYR
jgi:hypothetical protein